MNNDYLRRYNQNNNLKYDLFKNISHESIKGGGLYPIIVYRLIHHLCKLSKNVSQSSQISKTL